MTVIVPSLETFHKQMATYTVLLLGGFIAGSRYGLTIGRPIVQSSTWHFTYAETLQFPYPITVTFVQLAITYMLLLLLDSINFIYEYGHPRVSDLHENIRSVFSLTAASSTNIRNQTTELFHYLGSGFRSNKIEIFETLLLAISIAATDVLTTYTLSAAPFQIFLFASSFTIPVSIFLTRYFSTLDVVPSKAILPAAMLCLGIAMAAYRPNLPMSSRSIWAAVLSSLFAAIWPVQLERTLRSHGDNTRIKYQRISGESIVHSETSGSVGNPSYLRVLQRTILLAAGLLIPILLFSGELGHISRNCYFLRVTNFWVSLLAGACFRFILLISSALYIKKTSALSFIIMMALIEVSQVGPLTYSKMLTSQWLALTLCSLTAIWLHTYSFSPSTISSSGSENSWDGGGTRESWSLFRKASLQSFLSAFTNMTLVLGCIQTFREGGISVPNTESPISYSSVKPFPDVLHGNDAYLGSRLPTQAVVNFSMIIEKCRGTYEHLENINNIHRCLNFLSTEEQTYVSTPVHTLSHLSAPILDFAELNGSILDTSTIINISSNSGEVDVRCNGQIIPYHIWWTGLPTWRIELFIKSYFFTQNLACSKLWIWINTDHHPGAMHAWLHYPRFQRFNSLIARGDIVLKEWKLPPRVLVPPHIDELDRMRYYAQPRPIKNNGERLVADSIIRDSAGREWVQIYQEGDEPQLTYFIVAVSDAARLIILHLHGGVYMDPDMILLRDIRPLLLANRGFAERWGTSVRPEAYNNGLLYLPANSTISTYLLLGGTRMGMVYHFLSLGRMLVQEGRDDKHIDDPRSLLKLENAFFDPIWVENDGRRVGRCSVPCLTSFEQLFQGSPVPGEWDAFDGELLEGASSTWSENVIDATEKVTINRTLENFYRGAYAVHVHNLWGLQYQLGSWIDVIARAHDGFFVGERSNAYGERWEGPSIEGYVSN